MVFRRGLLSSEEVQEEAEFDRIEAVLHSGDSGHLCIKAEVAVEECEAGIEYEAADFLVGLMVYDVQVDGFRFILLVQYAVDVDARDGGEADAEVVVFPKLEAESDGEGDVDGLKVGILVVGVEGDSGGGSSLEVSRRVVADKIVAEVVSVSL